MDSINYNIIHTIQRFDCHKFKGGFMIIIVFLSLIKKLNKNIY